MAQALDPEAQPVRARTAAWPGADPARTETTARIGPCDGAYFPIGSALLQEIKSRNLLILAAMNTGTHKTDAYFPSNGSITLLSDRDEQSVNSMEEIEIATHVSEVTGAFKQNPETQRTQRKSTEIAKPPNRGRAQPSGFLRFFSVYSVLKLFFDYVFAIGWRGPARR